jgi:hypothetical protein
MPEVASGRLVSPVVQESVRPSMMEMTLTLRRMTWGIIAVHDFRSTFRNEASRQTSYRHETCEDVLKRAPVTNNLGKTRCRMQSGTNSSATKGNCNAWKHGARTLNTSLIRGAPPKPLVR